MTAFLRSSSLLLAPPRTKDFLPTLAASREPRAASEANADPYSLGAYRTNDKVKLYT